MPYSLRPPPQANCVTNVCQSGNNLLSSGYCMYSSSVILVLSFGRGVCAVYRVLSSSPPPSSPVPSQVYGFTLDQNVGEFVLSHENVKIPQSGRIYSFNEGNYAMWQPGLKSYMDSLKTGGAAKDGKPYSARYIGSLVGDFHRTMLYGGIYGYPGDSKNVNGKLRLLYECAPMSFLAEQAGGKGVDGKGRVLDIVPDKVHQRVPFFVGSAGEVDYLMSHMK